MSANGEADRPGSNVDVCIVSFDSAPVLERTIGSVVTHLPGATISIREHGSDASRLAALREIIGSCPSVVRLDVDPTNPGFGSGCNAIASASTADWLLFLNPDAEIVRWPWDAVNQPPSGQVTGPHMLGAGETARQSGRSYRVRDEILRSWLRRPGRRPDGRGFVSGAALLIDRHSFGSVGGFDESYFMFYEDIDLCLRANAAGISTHLDPGWRVLHAGAHSTRSRFGSALEWSYVSACRFHARRGSSVTGYRIYVITDAMARAGFRIVLGNWPLGRAYLGLARRAIADFAAYEIPSTGASAR